MSPDIGEEAGKLIEEAGKWRRLFEWIKDSEVKSPWALISAGAMGAYAASKTGMMDGVIVGIVVALLGVAWLVERRYKCMVGHEHSG